MHALLTALAQQATPPVQKRTKRAKEPDPFSDRTPDKLRAFIFQCQIYFQAYKGEFKEDTKKIFFAISYPCGVALDYFEPFISEECHKLPNSLKSIFIFISFSFLLIM